MAPCTMEHLPLDKVPESKEPEPTEPEPTEPEPKELSVQSFLDAERHRKRDEFIACIHEEEVLRLASSYHNDKPCSFFWTPSRGSFNVCYFVEFPPQGACAEKWVVGVPLEPCLAFGGWDKLESEIATMQLVAERTAIPIPKIHAYGVGRGHAEPLSSFLILEYIEGEQFRRITMRELSAEQMCCLDRSLADIYIQLRRLEFPSIGRLVRRSDGSFEVGREIASIDINEQELARARPSLIQSSYHGEANVLKSARAYIDVFLDIADNAFANTLATVSQDGQGEKALYWLHTFREHIERWVDSRLDKGPFVLVHGDLEPWNLIVDKNMEVVSVFDWEWSRVVPRQFFSPAFWLIPRHSKYLPIPTIYNLCLGRVDQFIAIMRARERERYGNELLSDEWAEMGKDGGFLIPNALDNWFDIKWFSRFYIDPKRYRGSDLDPRVRAFMEEDPDRQALVARKRAEHDAGPAAWRQQLRGTGKCFKWILENAEAEVQGLGASSQCLRESPGTRGGGRAYLSTSGWI